MSLELLISRNHTCLISLKRFIQGMSKASVKYSIGRFKIVKEHPNAKRVFSKRVGSLGNWLILLQNQKISPRTKGKNTDFRESQTLVNPPF